MPKPRHLALGVLSGVVDGDAASLPELKFAAEMAKQLRRAMRFQPRPCRLGLPLEHGARFGEHALFQHGVEARFDPVAQPGPVGGAQDRAQPPGRWLTLSRRPMAERLATPN